METNEIRLTQYSKGSGCGCKIAPDALEAILKGIPSSNNASLIVGNSQRDDAAVYDLGNDQYLISTVDFFTPIVDNPYDFGRIAAANALSDVFAMGGRPILATAVFGWPVDRLPAELASEVLKGGNDICVEAGIPLAGGHSVDIPEPVFGLSVNGLVHRDQLKKNDGGQVNDLIYLTKPLGTGMLSTALKRGILEKEELKHLIHQMTTINKIGHELGSKSYVSSMTDVTGFGLLGHLMEMCKGSGNAAEIFVNDLPLLLPDKVKELIAGFVFPDNTMRNYKSYHEDCETMDGKALGILCDPQTNGGLMVTLDPSSQKEFEEFMASQNQPFYRIGCMRAIDDEKKRIRLRG